MTDASLPYLGFANIQELTDDTQMLLLDSFVVPNSWVPERYRIHKGSEVNDYCPDGSEHNDDDHDAWATRQIQGPSLGQVLRKYNAEVAESVAAHDHAVERDRRIELYRAQMESGSESIDYEPYVVDAKSTGRPNALFGE